MVEHMQKARALEHEKAAALDKPRKGRSSALENSVVAFLLATPLRAGAPGQASMISYASSAEFGLELAFPLIRGD